MTKTVKLPLIVLGRSSRGSSPASPDPTITFELEAETGELFETSFSLRGILSTVVMARVWTPLLEQLDEIGPPIPAATAHTESPAAPSAPDEIRCSFCGKNQDEATHIVAGPTQAICDECIKFCSGVIADRDPNWRL